MSTPRIPYDLMLWLEELHPPKGIGPSEDPIAAHRRAAKTELVEWLREHFNKQSPETVIEQAAAHVDPDTGVKTYDMIYAGLAEDDD